MPSPTTISVDKLLRLVGTPNCPVLIDVRTDEDFAADPRLIPGSIRRSHETIKTWAQALSRRTTIVVCKRGKKISEGAAAWLRHLGIAAEALEGGFDAWAAEKNSLVPFSIIPAVHEDTGSVWVTRARPKIDRIACPWLIRRFVDPKAVFMFVAPTEVLGVAERFNATPFDVEDVFWSHRGGQCTFDVMIEEFELTTAPLLRIATIVRGADTSRLDLAPEAAGLLAASLGLSRMFSNDLEQMEAGMMLYDAFYRWARDATAERHNWPSATIGTSK